MPIIYFSTKLLKLIGNSQVSIVSNKAPIDFRYAWNAQLFHFERHKCIIVTNKSTLYSFVRVGILKKELLNFPEFFVSSLLNQLEADKLKTEDEVRNWNINKENFICSKTDNDKPVIGSINDFIHQVKSSLEYGTLKANNPSDTLVATYCNTLPMGLLGYKTPLDYYRASQNNG